MISWLSIAYGAALSAVIAAAVVRLVRRERRLDVLATVAGAALIGPAAWNAILRSAGAPTFFHDAPVVILPASWQDTGSGVFTLATATVLLGFGAMARSEARAAASTAVLAGLSAFLVDVYLY